MSKGTVNKVILIGRLGADPEVKILPNGGQVTRLRLVTNEGYKNKQTGELVETSEWHNVSLFGRSAEIAGEYLKKGRMVYIEGRIETKKWKDKKTGLDRHATTIAGTSMQLLGGRDEGVQQKPFVNQGNSSEQQHSNIQNGSHSANKGMEMLHGASQRNAPQVKQGGDNYDDAIPF